MKYLSHYTQAAQTELLEKVGAFFAFGQKQFDEQKVEGVKYYSLRAGLFVPQGKENELTEGLAEISKKGREADLAENGIKGIIHRELGNYECQISCDMTPAVEALEPYGITENQVKAEWKEFWDICVENDFF